MDVEIKRDGIILRGKIEKPYNTNNKKYLTNIRHSSFFMVLRVILDTMKIAYIAR